MLVIPEASLSRSILIRERLLLRPLAETRNLANQMKQNELLSAMAVLIHLEMQIRIQWVP